MTEVGAHLKPLACLLRGVTDPRALASIFEKAEAELARTQHPDPYRRKHWYYIALSSAEVLILDYFSLASLFPDGTKWLVPEVEPLLDERLLTVNFFRYQGTKHPGKLLQQEHDPK